MKRNNIAISIFLVSLLTASYMAFAKDEGPAKAEATEIKRIAAEKYPNLPASEAEALVAKERNSQFADSLKNEGQRANLAADEFSAYINYNTKSRVFFCNELGIDISAFSNELVNSNSAEIEQTKRIYDRLQISYEPIWAELSPLAAEQMKTDMQNVASEHNTTVLGACELFKDKAPEMAKLMAYSSSYPDKSAALLEFRP